MAALSQLELSCSPPVLFDSSVFVAQSSWRTRGAQLSAVSKQLQRLLASSASAQLHGWQQCSFCEVDMQTMSAEWFAQDLATRVSPETAIAKRMPWLVEGSAGGADRQLISAETLRLLEDAARRDFGPLAQMCDSKECSSFICYQCISTGKASRCAHVAKARDTDVKLHQARGIRLRRWYGKVDDVMRSSTVEGRPDTGNSRWIIACDSIFCRDCAPEPCQICLRAFGQSCCGGMELSKCKLCSVVACDECEDAWSCDKCEDEFHERCKPSQCCASCSNCYCSECDEEFFCESCEESLCSNCAETVSCSMCSHTTCGECVQYQEEPIRRCDFCDDHFCADCRPTAVCEACGKVACSQCRTVNYCESCEQECCADCRSMTQCESCNEYRCEVCLDNGCNCDDCKQLEQCDSCTVSFCNQCSDTSLSKCNRCEHAFCKDCDPVAACTSCGVHLCQACLHVDGSEAQICERW